VLSTRPRRLKIGASHPVARKKALAKRGDLGKALDCNVTEFSPVSAGMQPVPWTGLLFLGCEFLRMVATERKANRPARIHAAVDFQIQEDEI